MSPVSVASMEVGAFRGTAAQWDTFVRKQRGWTHFHLWGWRDVIERVFGHDCPYLAARETDGTLVGVLPLVRVRSVLFGHYLVSMPFLNYGGPLGDPKAVRLLARRASELSRDEGASLLELRSRVRLGLELPVSHRKVTVLLDLPPGDPSALWESLKSKVRSQVRRPRKEGVTVRFGRDLLDDFFRVFARHMRDLGTPTQSRDLFETIADVFGDDLWCGCAYLDGAPIAAGCGLKWKDEFEMTWASALHAHNRIAPNMLLYWSFMERAAGEGLRTFNFGRCSPGSGTHRFKRQWGGRDQRLWWYQGSESSVEATPSPDEGPYTWGPAVWRRLPLSVANTVGPRIVQYIP